MDNVAINHQVIKVMKPPVVRKALNDVSGLLHPTSFLSPFLDDLERLLMVTSTAPCALDSIPFASKVSRSALLVATVRTAHAGNPALGEMIRRVLPGLVKDRAARGADAAEADVMVESVREVSRMETVQLRAPRPRY